ncbi:MAG TPA: hypothetical protein VFH78_07565 [Candidatus Thermoplasmatota archaeon]|nr:hypothetical protein [Candidatus Thermoplasmatota archaeon]
MRTTLALLFAVGLAAGALAAPASAQAAGTGYLVVNVLAPGANQTFSFAGSGAGLAASFQVGVHNGQGAVPFVDLQPGVHRSVAFAGAPGWYLHRATCTAGTPSSIAISAGGTTTCTFELRNGTPPPATKPARPAKGHGGGHADADGADAGGYGYWKNADRHVPRALLDQRVANVSAASAWLMPPGYAANASGARALLEDGSRGCGRGERAECELVRFQARLLVLRLNLDAGVVSSAANVTLDEATASYLGLPRATTVGAVLAAIEGKAGGASETAEQLQLLRAAAQRASAHGR